MIKFLARRTTRRSRSSKTRSLTAVPDRDFSSVLRGSNIGKSSTREGAQRSSSRELVSTLVESFDLRLNGKIHLNPEDCRGNALFSIFHEEPSIFFFQGTELRNCRLLARAGSSHESSSEAKPAAVAMPSRAVSTMRHRTDTQESIPATNTRSYRLP